MPDSYTLINSLTKQIDFMIYRIFFLFSFLMLSGISFGQSSFGLSIGQNNSNYRYIVNYTNLQTTGMLTGLRFSLDFQKQFSQALGIRTELSYNNRGFYLYRNYEGGTQLVSKTSMQFVESVLMVRFGGVANKKLAPYLEMGPGIALRYASKTKQFMARQYKNSLEVTDLLPVEAFYTIGTGFAIPVASTQVNIYVRYLIGLHSVYVPKRNNTFLRPQNFNFGISVSLWKSSLPAAKKACSKPSCIN